ncbi:MAG: metal-dependent hydrolase [Methanocorpusculum sp.]|nr:metal-dependent hydrolase [Methanocorpusculum sp.]
MLIFFHLFIGLTAGVILAVLLSNKMAILYGGIGGILPDILDKPLGMIFLADNLIGGRIYFHSLTIGGILVILGLILWYSNKQRIILLCISIGILLHQIGDTMWDAASNWFWPTLGPFEPYTEEFPPVPDGALLYLSISTWIIAVIAGILFSMTAYRHLRQLIRTRSGIRKTGILTGIILAGIGMILLVKYIIWDIFLSGPWADYFGTMYLHEILSVSEWVYGLVSLILILLVLNYPLSVSEKYQAGIFRICGIGSITISLLILLFLFLGFPIEEVYGSTIWKLIAVSGFLIGGAVLLFLGKRISTLSGDIADSKR